MFTNWLTYRVVAEQLDRSLKGHTIGEVFSQDRNELIINIAGRNEPGSLHFSAHPQSAFLVHRNEFSRARKNTVSLMPELPGKIVRSVNIAATDRVIRMTFHDGSYLVVLLYATKSNILYYNAVGEITESFKKTERIPDLSSLEFDDAITVPTLEELQASQQSNPDTSLGRILKQLRPWISGTFATEILRRTALDPQASIRGLDQTGLRELQEHISGALDECCAPPWHLYTLKNLPEAFSLIQLGNEGYDEQPYGNIHEALFDYYKLRERTKRLKGQKAAIMKAIDRELDRVQRGLAKSADEPDLNAKADLYEKYGNLLMINLERTPEQPGQMTVDDMFDGMGTVISIPIDQKLTVLENSQRYYEKARNTRASIDYVNKRRAELKARRDWLSKARTLFDDISDYGALRDAMADNKDVMNDLGFTAKGNRQEQFPFRRFSVAGGFDVWAGKNSQNNDLLTVRNSKPNDIWFHARGVGGSHVVIKVDSAPGKPGRDTIREAAAIAAYYSKHRNAKSVPVAYTEKKYVSKPKGVPAGTVTLSREKVIMVQPGLPEGSIDTD